MHLQDWAISEIDAWGAHDAYPELFRLGKTEFDGGISHAFSASGKSRDAAGVGTTFEEHSLGDSVAEWPPATIQGDGFYSPWIWRYLELFAASVALCESHKLWLAVMHSEQRSCRGQQAAMCRSKRRLSKDIKGMIIVRVFRTSSSAKQEHACGTTDADKEL